MRLVKKSRPEQQVHEFTETVRRCCDGYAETPGPEKKCQPICVKSCVFGSCTHPDTCTCYEGYKTKDDQPNVCEPACTGCSFGTCVSPQFCQCNPGYDWHQENVECVPFCSSKCENGKCSAPEICECDDGYALHPNQSNICVPHCKESCKNGVCIEPNKCECDFGYQFANGSQSICEPQCEMSCKNAKCTAPNVCECHNGYTILDNNKPHECHCGLYCVEIDGMCHCLDEGQRVNGDQIQNNISSICTESNCENGYCATPNDCKCDNGYEKNENNFCSSMNETCIDDPSNCDGHEQTDTCSCVNGICAANHTCFCVNGFKMSQSHEFICEPFCKDDCVNGFCINPDSCECHNGYRLGYNESESHICHPICDPEAEDNNGCINGVCIAPDTCQCNEGFELDLVANYTCIPLPYNAATRTGTHWILSGVLFLIVFVACLSVAAFFAHRKRTKQFYVPKEDEANEPITAYLHEEM